MTDRQDLILGARLAGMSINVKMARAVAKRALADPDPDVRAAAQAALDGLKGYR